MSKASGRPMKGARKLTIDGETWWWKYSTYKIPIWDPQGTKHLHDVKPGYVKEYYDEYNHPMLTPFDIRIHIDRHIRKRPEAEVKALIDARDDRIKRARREHINTLRQMVLARAKVVVSHSNQLFHEYHGGDEIDESNELQNKTFIDNLLCILAYDMAQED